MRESDLGKILTATALSLMLSACQGDSQKNITQVNEEPITPIEVPTIIPATVRPYTAPKPFIPEGWDKLIGNPVIDPMYSWTTRKVERENDDLRLLTYKEEIVARVEDSRGIDLRDLPDFGIGRPNEKRYIVGQSFSYSKIIQLWVDENLEEEWAIIEDKIRTSNQAEINKARRSFSPLTKGRFRFAYNLTSPSEPTIYEWASI